MVVFHFFITTFENSTTASARELRGCGEQFGFVKQRCCTFGGAEHGVKL